MLHNIGHLLFGVAGILMARTDGQARNFLLYGGGVYLVLWLYGLLIGHDTPANFVPVNTADNWLPLRPRPRHDRLRYHPSRGSTHGADRREEQHRPARTPQRHSRPA